MARPKKTSASAFDKMSLKELVELEGKIQKAIAAARDKERAELRKKMAEMASDHGFSVTDLFGGGRGAKGAKKTVGVAKYANPDNRGDTWTGRGRKPNWVLERLKKGGKLADFEI